MKVREFKQMNKKRIKDGLPEIPRHERPCLSCGKNFISISVFNRLCPKCKGKG